MNIQQLEYIIELNKNHSFSLAADICSVTQPTLSTMVQKLEDELEVIIFDRTNKTKIMTTDIGLKIIDQAQRILDEVSHLKNIAKEEKDEIIGNLKISIIPSISSFLLPTFLNNYTNKYKQVVLSIREEVTLQLINNLKNRLIDIGICAGPLNQKDFQEIHLFYDPFLIFTLNEELLKKDFISEKEIQQVDIYLLQQEHCFHGQVLSLCK
ncbi:MAG: LysR family transcriptional regulator, partial [Chitinophagaceae bacterium]